MGYEQKIPQQVSLEEIARGNYWLVTNFVTEGTLPRSGVGDLVRSLGRVHGNDEVVVGPAFDARGQVPRYSQRIVGVYITDQAYQQALSAEESRRHTLLF